MERGIWITRRSWNYVVCSNCSFETKKWGENAELPSVCPHCYAAMSGLTGNLSDCCGSRPLVFSR